MQFLTSDNEWEVLVCQDKKSKGQANLKQEEDGKFNSEPKFEVLQNIQVRKFYLFVFHELLISNMNLEWTGVGDLYIGILMLNGS